MSKSYYSIGLMSGTSMDGVDASIIQSDGETKYKVIIDKYFEYPQGIYKDLTKLRDKIKSSKDLKNFSKEIKNIEKEITLFHAKAVSQILKKIKVNVDLIGFHGQTIYHNAKERISKQLGDGNLLSKLTKKTVVYNFRENDIKHGGQGAPLTPIFHKLLAAQIIKKLKNTWSITIINIGGITNYTIVHEDIGPGPSLFADDIGPGNCLIDEWVRKKSSKKIDKDGLIARSGKPNRLVIKYALKKFNDDEFKKYLKEEENNLISKRTFDIKDFDISEFKSLSFIDGAASLTDFTAAIILQNLDKNKGPGHPAAMKWIVCGGGRKNKYLMESITKKAPDYLKSKKLENCSLNDWKDVSLEPIDNYGINGDFVESQAFAYLAIRSFLKLPISFPHTTGCVARKWEGFTGGIIVKY